MSDAKRHRIVAYAADALSGIAIEKGFRTDAGQSLFVGFVPQLGEDDGDAAIALVVGPDQIVRTGEKVLINLPLVVYAIAKLSLGASAWMGIEMMLADIKQALEIEDRSWGRLLAPFLERGQTVTLEREPGSLVLGASITYIAPYTERWGAPEL